MNTINDNPIKIRDQKINNRLNQIISNCGYTTNDQTWESLIRLFIGGNKIYRHIIDVIIIRNTNEIFLLRNELGFHFPSVTVNLKQDIQKQIHTECYDEYGIDIKNIEKTGDKYIDSLKIPELLKIDDDISISIHGIQHEIYRAEFLFFNKENAYDKTIGNFYHIRDVYSKLPEIYRSSIMEYLRLNLNVLSSNSEYFTVKDIHHIDPNFTMDDAFYFIQNHRLEIENIPERNFSTSINDAIFNYREKKPGDIFIVCKSMVNPSKYIVSFDQYRHSVEVSDDIKVTPIHLVKMIDDENYQIISTETETRKNKIILYHSSRKELNYIDTERYNIFWDDYNKAYNFAVYLSVISEWKRSIQQNKMLALPEDVRWNDKTYKIDCTQEAFNTISKAFSNMTHYAYIYEFDIDKKNVYGHGPIKHVKHEVINSANCLSFIIGMKVINDIMSIKHNDIIPEIESNRKYGVIVKDESIHLFNTLKEAIKNFMEKHRIISSRDLISVVYSDFFDTDVFYNYIDMDGYPVKKISKPISVWCDQCKIQYSKTTPITESVKRKTNISNTVVDFETTIIIEFLNSQYSTLKKLKDYFDDVYDEFDNTKTSEEKLLKILDKTDTILSSVKEDLEISKPPYSSACSKNLKLIKNDSVDKQIIKMRLKTIHDKYKDIVKGYNKLIDKIGLNGNRLVILPDEDHNDKVKMTRLYYRVCNGYKLTNDLYSKVDEILNP